MRLSASPCTHDYGALTLRIQLQHRVKYLRTVPATVFLPRPDVDSAVVRLMPRDPIELPEHDHELLLKLIRIGFSQRRKQLRKLLREHARDWNALASSLNIDPNARAEELSLLQWIALANCITPPPSKETCSTSNEPLPLVDKNDRIFGYASRAEVHEAIEQKIIELTGLSGRDERPIAVVGVQDEAKGEALVLLSAVDIDLAELRKKLQEAGVPNLWIPKNVQRIGAIPVLASGKLDLKRCQECAANPA